MQSLPRRAEVPKHHQWNIESVFPSEEAFEAAFAQVESQLPGLARFTSTLGSSAAQLLAALQERDTVDAALVRIAFYAHLQQSVDQNDALNTARSSRTRALAARFGATVSYFPGEILSIPPDTIAAFLDQEPALAVYRHYIEQLELLRGHVRSPEVEALLAQAHELGAAPSIIHSTLENGDLRFATVTDEHGNETELNPGTVDQLVSDPSRAVRRAAWEAFADSYLSVKQTMAAMRVADIGRNVFYARARHYASAREATMHPQNIPVAVFDNLIATVRAHLPLWHRYWGIRQRALGVGALQPYDIHLPLATMPEAMEYDAGVQLVLEGLAPLGEEYVGVLARGLTTERWVDRYANVGKQGGAFAWAVPGTRPFILHNYDNSLVSISTLAHEAGHAMHSYFSCAHQPPIYADYSMFVAETASNFNQALLRAHLLRTNKDRRVKIAILQEGLENFHRYFFIMPILAQFELEAHTRVERGDGLTIEDLSSLMVELYREGFGAQVVIDEPRVGITWAQFPHMFGNFYVYQYATGIAAATALADGVLAEGGPAVERYLNFLKAGDSLFPLDALKLAGVDMSTPQPIERAFAVLESLVDQLDTLVGARPLPWLPAQQ